MSSGELAENSRFSILWRDACCSPCVAQSPKSLQGTQSYARSPKRFAAKEARPIIPCHQGPSSLLQQPSGSPVPSQWPSLSLCHGAHRPASVRRHTGLGCPRHALLASFVTKARFQPLHLLFLLPVSREFTVQVRAPSGSEHEVQRLRSGEGPWATGWSTLPRVSTQLTSLSLICKRSSCPKG